MPRMDSHTQTRDSDPDPDTNAIDPSKKRLRYTQGFCDDACRSCCCILRAEGCRRHPLIVYCVIGTNDYVQVATNFSTTVSGLRFRDSENRVAEFDVEGSACLRDVCHVLI